MKKMLIVEDSVQILAQLSYIAREINSSNKIYAFEKLEEAYRCALENDIDLFVVDIILEKEKPGDISGLQYVENIRKIDRYKFIPVIFVTSLEDAKLHTYEKLHCYSFIEKPFDESKMKNVMEECLQFYDVQQANKTLFFRKDGIILALDREEILYSESIQHIMYIHTTKEDTLSIPYITVKKLLEDLNSNEFMQCSRNVIVNKKYIYNVDTVNRIIELKNGERVEIGITYKKKIKENYLAK